VFVTFVKLKFVNTKLKYFRSISKVHIVQVYIELFKNCYHIKDIRNLLSVVLVQNV